MPRIQQVYRPKNTLKFFATERGAKAFARRECHSINVKWDSFEAGPAVLELNDMKRGSRMRHVGVALLRRDQNWMVPHLRERGLSCRIIDNSTEGRE